MRGMGSVDRGALGGGAKNARFLGAIAIPRTLKEVKNKEEEREKDERKKEKGEKRGKYAKMLARSKVQAFLLSEGGGRIRGRGGETI